MTRFFATFDFRFAGYFTPQIDGGMCRRNV